jgi:sentrin-specific protease 1
VKMDDISVKQRYLSCLLDKDKWVEDEVISAYIYCMKDQLYVQDHQNKVYFEDPFVTSLLKRDGKIGIHGPTSMTKIVKNYLIYDMVILISIIVKF